MKGSLPSSGSAFFTPPPVSRSSPRSSEMTMRGVSRVRRCASSMSAKWCTFTTTLSMPASCSRSRAKSIRLRPATFTRGFGIVAVIGSMRLPKPAARTMALRGAREGVWDKGWLRIREGLSSTCGMSRGR